MLEFAQIEAGNFQLNMDTFDLQNVFNHCIIPYKKKALEKNLDFKKYAPQSSTPWGHKWPSPIVIRRQKGVTKGENFFYFFLVLENFCTG